MESKQKGEFRAQVFKLPEGFLFLFLFFFLELSTLHSLFHAFSVAETRFLLDVISLEGTFLPLFFFSMLWGLCVLHDSPSNQNRRKNFAQWRYFFCFLFHFPSSYIYFTVYFRSDSSRGNVCHVNYCLLLVLFCFLFLAGLVEKELRYLCAGANGIEIFFE